MLTPMEMSFVASQDQTVTSWDASILIIEDGRAGASKRRDHRLTHRLRDWRSGLPAGNGRGSRKAKSVDSLVWVTLSRPDATCAILCDCFGGFGNRPASRVREARSLRVQRFPFSSLPGSLLPGQLQGVLQIGSTFCLTPAGRRVRLATSHRFLEKEGGLEQWGTCSPEWWLWA